jgi:hypothetical protein
MSAEDHEPLNDLSVFAHGVYAVELSDGKKLNRGHRVALKASVDPTTGKVEFSVDPAEIPRLRSQL